MHRYEVLRHPLITEKNTLLQSQGKYAFEVARQANKQQVKHKTSKQKSHKLVSHYGIKRAFGS